MESLKNVVARGAVWVLLENLSTQMVGFVVSMILARLLLPKDYGTVALLSIFIAVAGVLSRSGLGNALIQKKNVTDLEYNSVFYISLVLSGGMYLALFFLAPCISRYYEVPILCPLLRVAAISLIFNAVDSIQNAELNRRFLFHLSFRISLLASFISGCVGLSMAWLGYGPWALVGATVCAGLAAVIVRWFVIAWRPRLMFSWNALSPLFKYGWKLMVSGLLDSIFNNLYGLLIGKWYSRQDLAFVNKGRHLPELVMNNVNGALGRVAFPALAQMQDNRVRLREAMREMIRLSTFFIFPLMTMLAVFASPTVLLLYGEQWMPSVIYVQLACFSFALWPFHTINLQAIQAVGRSDVFLVLEIIKKLFGVLALVASLQRGVLCFMAVSAFLTGPFCVLVNAWPNRSLLGYSLIMQVRDVMGCVVLSVVMFIVMLLWQWVPLNMIVKCALQALTGTLTYGLLSYYFDVGPSRLCVAKGSQWIMTRMCNA